MNQVNPYNPIYDRMLLRLLQQNGPLFVYMFENMLECNFECTFVSPLIILFIFLNDRSLVSSNALFIDR